MPVCTLASVVNGPHKALPVQWSVGVEGKGLLVAGDEQPVANWRKWLSVHYHSSQLTPLTKFKKPGEPRVYPSLGS